MSFRQAGYPAAELDLLGQVVAEPRFSRLTNLSTFALPEIGVLVGAYVAIAVASILYLTGHAPYWVPLTVNTLSIYPIFTPLHDATHRSASRHPVVNDWIGNLAALPLLPGFTTGLYRYLHLEHHRHTGDPERDPDDVFVSAPMPWRIVAWMFVDVRWMIFYLGRRRERPVVERRRFAGGVVFFGVWHAVGLLSPYAGEFVMLWLIPQRLGLMVLAYLFAAIQHPEGVLQDERPLQATRMLKGGAPIRWLTLGQSEHLMHHMFPAVPYYRYHDAWRIAEPLLRTREIVWDWPIPPLRMPSEAVPPPVAETIRARIVHIEDVSAEVRAYTLAPAGETPFPVHAPGAHVDVHIRPGLVRQYSLSTAPHEHGCYRIGVKREVGGRGGSRAIHETFAVGLVVEISPPRNHFVLSDDTRSVQLVAGGIGITPLLAMAEALAKRGSDFAFHVCARSRTSLPFAAELTSAPYADRVRLHLGDRDGQQRLTAGDLPPWSEGQELYLCGPPLFMAHVIELAESRGWPDEAIHTESFIAPAVDPSKNRPFEVVLGRSGRTLFVPPHRSLLQVLRENHVGLPASCTQGLCGTCVCRVVAGEVDHRDWILREKDRRAGKMTTCVSRATGDRLVLDL